MTRLMAGLFCVGLLGSTLVWLGTGFISWPLSVKIRRDLYSIFGVMCGDTKGFRSVILAEVGLIAVNL